MSYRIVVFFAHAKRAGARGSLQSPAADSSALRQIELLHRSARVHDGDVAMTVLSDQHTALADLQTDATIDRQVLDTNDLMMSRTRAQARFVEGHDFDRPLAFLDFDILVNRPIAPLFSRPFDIGVTARNKPAMPINGGVILANNRRPDAVRAFFNGFLGVYVSRYANQAAWWGDQRALNDMVRAGRADASGERGVTRDGIDYLILPAHRYNYSPHVLGASLALPRRNKYILHFKNEARKKFIAPYFALHMNQDGAAWWSRVVRAYRLIG